MSGLFSNLTVEGLQGNAVSGTAPNDGEILKWNATSNEWEPATDDGEVYTAGTGVAISAGNVISNTGDTDASDDLTTASTASGDVSGLFSNLTVEGLQGNAVSSTAPNDGEILKWNATSNEWEPATDIGDAYTAGAGVAISAGNVISNTGDTDASDDLTTASTASGDVSGLFSNLTVEGLQGNAVSGTAPSDGEILKWNAAANEWQLVNDLNDVYTAGTGVAISAGNVISNTGDTDASDDITTSSIAAGDVTGAFSNLIVGGLQGNAVAATLPTDGQVLQWNATTNEWEPALDDGEVYTAGTGVAISAGNVISNTGDTDASDDLTTASTAGGDASGLFSGLTVTGLQGNAVSGNAPNDGEILKWNAINNEWQLESDENDTYTAGPGVAISAGNVISNTGDPDASDDLTTSSNAAGDVTGLYSNLTVVGLQGNDVSTVAPNSGEILKWNAITSEWEPAADVGEVYTAGAGVAISAGNVISNTGDTDASDDLTTASTAGGDVSGLFSNLSVDAIKGNTVSGTSPDNMDVLKWNATANEWQPMDDSVIVYTGGTGIDVTGSVITNTGDTDPSDDVTDATSSGGDVSGVFSALTVEGIQGNAVSGATPANADVLKWDATTSEWIPSVDNGQVYTAGTGINIAAGVISNTGDINPGDDVTVLTTAGGDVSGVFGNLSVDKIKGNNISATAPADEEILKWNALANEWEPAVDSFNVYTAGAGISIANNVVTNTGDPDASDDLTTASTAGGDADGTFAALTVTGLQGNDVSATAPADEEILKWNATAGEWEPAVDSFNVYTAGAGISIANNVVTNTGDPDGSDDLTTGSTAGGDADGTFAALTVTGLQGNDVSANAPTDEEILKWDATAMAWTPANDSFNVYTAGAGVSIVNNVITNTGDPDGSDDLTTASTAGGDADGTFAALTVTGLQGNDVSATPPTDEEILKWDATAMAWTPASDSFNVYTAGTGVSILNNVVTNTGDTDASDDLTTASTAGGDADGAFASLTVTGLQGNDVSATMPTDEEVLKWDATAMAWTPSSDSFNVYTAGTGVSIVNNVVTNTGDTDASDDLTTASTAGGDADGAFASLTVTGLQGNGVENKAPDTDEVLVWDGTNWTPDTLSTTALLVNSTLEPNAAGVYDLGSATFQFQNVFATSGMVNISDMRAKQDVVDLDYGLEELLEIRPVSYVWKDRAEDGRKLGVIAQELAQVMPELVKTHRWEVDPQTGERKLVEMERYGVYYSDLIPVLVQGIQEQQTQIHDQAAKLEAQQEQLDQQSELIQKLEERLSKLEAQK